MDDKQIEQLKKLDLFSRDPQLAIFDELQALNDGISKLSKSDLLDSFESVIVYLKKMEEKMNSDTSEIRGELLALAEEVRQGASEDVSEAKTRLESILASFPEALKIYDQKLAPIILEIGGLKNAIANIPALKEEIIAEIPEQEKIDLTKLGGPIRDGLEALEGDERLKIEAIKNLREELDELKKLLKKGGGGGVIYAGGGGGKGHIKPYDLSDQLNGVLKTFNLPANWTVISVCSASFPNAFRPIIDYTFTPTTITFTSEITASSTLAAGQSVIVVYEES